MAFFHARAGYRPDIDGLRAIAVLSVMGFHYRQFIRGGFTGVDVFFVISGFLITQYLATEMAAGTFSLLNFYDRRIRRIMPALLVMLAAVLLAGRLLLTPRRLRHTGGQRGGLGIRRIQLSSFTATPVTSISFRI